MENYKEKELKINGSKITSLLGIVSLIMQICSYTLTITIESIITTTSFAIGITISVFFLIPSIFLAFYEIRSPSRGSEYERRFKGGFILRLYLSGFKFSDHPLGAIFSLLYGISFLLSGLFVGLLMLEYVPPTENPTPGITLVILWILSGILGIVGAFLYRDYRSPDKHTPRSINWQEP